MGVDDFEARVGSSPQARGTRRRPGHSYLTKGIIPAGAGNSRAPGVLLGDEWDHPRRRGDLQIAVSEAILGAGSSPQARGTPELDYDEGGRAGIIPAGAGNSGLGSGSLAMMWDHPRRRGELIPVLTWLARLLGSSPQARGTQIL